MSILSYNLFCEGLFSLDSDNQIANVVYDKLLTYIKIYEVKESDKGFVVKSVKLDSNPGVYDVYSSEDSLILEYYKSGVKVFTQEIKCVETLKTNIYDLIKKYFRG